MKRGVAKILSAISGIIVLAVCLALIISGREAAILVVFVIYLPVAMFLNHCLRCPHCGAWPRKGSFLDGYCPRCGEPLED